MYEYVVYVCMHAYVHIHIHTCISYAHTRHLCDMYTRDPSVYIRDTSVTGGWYIHIIRIYETPLLQAAGVYTSYVYTRHLCHRRQEDKQKKHKAIKMAAKRKAFKEWRWGVNAANIFGAFIHTAMHEGCLHAVKKCGAALTLCTIIQVQMYMRIYKYT